MLAKDFDAVIILKFQRLLNIPNSNSTVEHLSYKCFFGERRHTLKSSNDYLDEKIWGT